MEELIRINYEGEQPRVSGRELHEALGIESKYTDWFRRMRDYGFEEGRDFNSLFFEQVRNEGGREVTRQVIDHSMTIPMAKELCMLQRSEIGKKIRLYFIQVEEAWNKPELVMARALQMANQSLMELQQENQSLGERVKEQEKTINNLEPKARYAEYVLNSPSLVLVTQIAKDYGMSAIALNRKLHKMRIQYRVGKQWVLYAIYQDKGYTHSRTVMIPLENGQTKTKMQTEWTQEGRMFIYEKLKEDGILPLLEREGEADAGRSE